MIAYAPVMYVGNSTSIFCNLAIKLGLDTLIEKYFNSILWIKDGTSVINTLIYDFAPTFLSLVPRTTWSFVQGIVGYDAVSHMDPKMMPMMARNDVGGSGTQNLKHWSTHV